MDFRLYPTFQFIESRGQFLPNIHLPDNYREIVPLFYEEGRKESVEEYAKTLEEKYLKGELEIKLLWDEQDGLTNISVGPSGGLDLEDRGRSAYYQEHNLGTRTGIASGFIAMFYISELLKSRKEYTPKVE